MTTRTPDWLVERLHAGDLPSGEAERVRARLEAEGGLGRLEALRADDAAFREAHPPGPALGEIRRRAAGWRAGAARPGRLSSPEWAPAALVLAPARRAAWRRALVPALAMAAVVVFAVVLVPRGGEVIGPADPGTEGTRVKGVGAPRLEVHRRLPGGEPEALAAGAAVRAGDLLQLSYVAAGTSYGVVVSIDGRGAVTLHLPEGGGRAVALHRGKAVALEHAYQLDDAPGFERFFLVTGKDPFDAGAVVEAARRLAALGAAEVSPLSLPPGLEQQSVLLTKR